MKIHLIKYYFLLVVLGLFSCKEQSIVENGNLSPIWEKDFNVGLTSCINPLIMGDNILFSSYQSRNLGPTEPSKLISLKAVDGSANWEWKNTWTDIPEDIDRLIGIFYLEDNIYYGYGSRIYSINSKNGKSNWFKQLDQGSVDFKYFLLDDIRFLTSFKSQNPDRQDLIEIDRLNGNTTLINTFPIPDSVSQTRNYFFIQDEIIYHSIARNKLNEENDRYVYPYVSAYDVSNDTMLYETQISEPDWLTVVTHLSIHNNEYLIATLDKLIVCVKAESGNLQWSISLNSNALYSGFITTESGLVYVNTEKNVTCIDIASGQIIWQITPEDHGLSSRMFIHKGLLYYISANLLNIVDASTGEIIQKIVAPSVYNEKSGEGFQSVLTLDPENDRLYTASYTHAYCYPTLR